MGIKEALQKLGEKSKQRKELLRRMDERVRLERVINDRQLSSNERELNGLMNEEREEMIKERLEVLRKRRDDDIKFNHNPLDAKNITNSVEWEVLREKNIFSKNKITINRGDGSVLKNNSNLLKNNKELFGI